jgi:hypothetical protein
MKHMNKFPPYIDSPSSKADLGGRLSHYRDKQIIYSQKSTSSGRNGRHYPLATQFFYEPIQEAGIHKLQLPTDRSTQVPAKSPAAPLAVTTGLMNLAGLGFLVLGRSFATSCGGTYARNDLKFPHHVEFVQHHSVRELGIRAPFSGQSSAKSACRKLAHEGFPKPRMHCL